MKKRLRLKDFSQEEQVLHHELEHVHMVEDVLSRYDCSVEDASDTAEIAAHILNKYDPYFEHYWACITAAAMHTSLREREDDSFADNPPLDGCLCVCATCGGCLQHTLYPCKHRCSLSESKCKCSGGN